jgi:hypothetical protein
MTVDKEVKAWGLWWNVKLTDDPAVWDGEIKVLNEMQWHLGALTDDQRLIRAHIAEFCRISLFFPDSIDLLCEEVGTGRFLMPLHVGCEGRGLLSSLGHVDAPVQSGWRSRILSEYREGLRCWLEEEKPAKPRGLKVFGFLGKCDEWKKALVERLITGIIPEGAAVTQLKEASERVCSESRGVSVLAGKVRPFACFDCSDCLETGTGPGCPCAYATLIDATLLCAGDQRAESFSAEFTRFAEEHVLVYSAALNSWLTGGRPDAGKLYDGLRYIAGGGMGVAGRVHAALGERSDSKIWLAGCLLKTVAGNQRWHNSIELIDAHPEATSWLRSAEDVF